MSSGRQTEPTASHIHTVCFGVDKKLQPRPKERFILHDLRNLSLSLLPRRLSENVNRGLKLIREMIRLLNGNNRTRHRTQKALTLCVISSLLCHAFEKLSLCAFVLLLISVGEATRHLKWINYSQTMLFLSSQLPLLPNLQYITQPKTMMDRQLYATKYSIPTTTTKSVK